MIKSFSKLPNGAFDRHWVALMVMIMLKNAGSLMVLVAILFAGLVVVSCGTNENKSQPSSTMLGYVPTSLDNSISSFVLDENKGSLTAGTSAAVGTRPLYVAITPDRKFLYVSNAHDSTISRLALDGNGGMHPSGEPTHLSSQNGQPYQLAVAPSGNFLYVGTTANSIEVFQINQQTGDLQSVQGSPFPIHSQATQLSLTASGHFLYAVGTDSDEIYSFSIDQATGQLTSISTVPVHSGMPLACIRVHPSDKYVLVGSSFDVNHDSEEIFVYGILANGALQRISASPYPSGYGGFWFTIAPDGRFVYAVAIFDNEIVGYTFNASDGSMSPIPGSPFHDGQSPASLAVCSTSQFMVVTRINPGSAATYEIDRQTGVLTLVPGVNIITGHNPINAILVDR